MNIRSLCLIHVFLFTTFFSNAQDSIRLNKKNGGYQFKLVKQINATSVKNQYKSGTCWSYSGMSFFESEIFRLGKGEQDLSEMFIVRNIYSKKADKYVRMHGHSNFSAGGVFHDVTNVIREIGLVPNEVYMGNPEYNGKNVHNELDGVLSATVNAVVKNPNGHLTNKWKLAYEATLDVYLGKIPTEFEYKGKKYTPKSFAASLSIDADNYIEITSFTHHPFYTKFGLEIPDNWSWDEVYNVPLEDLRKIIDYAIQTNYGVAWASDISEKYFSFTNGVAYVPEKDYDEMTQAEKDSMFTKPMKERTITQELRQLSFDNYSTEDDHGMHIIGIANDQNGTKYYLVKNSWGEERNDCKGYLYASENYVLLKTTCIMVHKDAVPKEIAKKMGIK
ncbi:MAG TPA: C1 family peptidase [Cytophagaceae bacterium]|jgi:bleomycin hydrolase|nr:C1 family peptidase [Cytophagaceae bacterium]